jgi:hypothetical protein
MDNGEGVLECPRCKLLSPATAEHCDCGYSFAKKSVSSSGPVSKATIGERMAVFWFLFWRSSLMAVVGGSVGFLVGLFVRSVLQKTILNRPESEAAYTMGLAAVAVVYISFVFAGVFGAAYFNRWLIGLLLRKRFTGFRLELRRPSPGPKNAVTLREALAVWWLMLWRGSITAFTVSFIIGFVYTFLGFGQITPTWMVWCSSGLGSFCGSIWAVRAMLRKQFKTFGFLIILGESKATAVVLK